MNMFRDKNFYVMFQKKDAFNDLLLTQPSAPTRSPKRFCSSITVSRFLSCLVFRGHGEIKTLVENMNACKPLEPGVVVQFSVLWPEMSTTKIKIILTKKIIITKKSLAKTFCHLFYMFILYRLQS